MKYKKPILLLVGFIITIIYIVHPYKVEANHKEEGPNKNLIRFHIRANSDREDDQNLKLKIRDEILREMENKFKGSKSIEESRNTILKNMDNMRNIAKDVIKDSGKDYDVSISLGKNNFPIRKYGNIVLPQGEYETLLIEIGKARGENWWCVMFPPLCFIDETHVASKNNTEDKGLGEFVVEEEKPLRFKSKIIEFFQNIIDR